MERVCRVCGGTFDAPVRRGRPPSLCSDVCRRVHARRWSREWSRGRYVSQAVRERRACEACGEMFVTPQAGVRFCRDVVCVRDRKVAGDRGLSVRELRAMRESSRCGLCGEPFGDRRKVVDHDHVSGAVRSVLCDGCNVGLGHVERLGWDAQLYLARHALDLRELCAA